MQTRSLSLGTALLVTVSVGLVGCSSEPAATADPVAQGPSAPIAAPAAPERVDALRFAEIVAAPGAQIIDVRTPEEFAEGHLDGAININVQDPEFMSRIAALDPSGLYAVYCRSGNRSQAAVTALADSGIPGVFELETGIIGWQEAGLPVVR